MSSSPLNILFLPRWYPHKYDPMPGLFIERQARALSARHQVLVLYVHPDPDCSSEFEIDFSVEHGVTVVRVYYKTPDIFVPGFSQITNMINFYRAHVRGLEVIGEFKPDLVHSHILTREAVIGHLFSRRYKVPHVISEHWSRYLPQNHSYTGHIRKSVSRYVVGKAKAVIAVSEVLKNAMISSRLQNDHYFVVPNVVDPHRETPLPDHTNNPRKQILHVSCFDDRSKNITGLLLSVSALAEKRSDFQLILAGEGPDLEKMKELADSLGLLQYTVLFTGLKEGDDLAALYIDSDFSVLSSNYETFGTVIIESLTYGTPVVTTNVGIAAEVIHQGNGILVGTHDNDALSESIDRMLDMSGSFDRETIRNEIRDRYSSESVGNRLSEIFSQITADV